MIVADKIPYSIYSDGNFKRRHLGDYFFVTRIAHDVDILEYPCEVSLESVQYEWVICCG